MTSVREFRQTHPLTFPLGVVVLCCLIALIGLRVHLGHLRSRERRELQRVGDLEEKCSEYRKLNARTGSGVDLLKSPGVLTTWGVEQIAAESGLAGRVKDSSQRGVPHGELVERLVTMSLTGVHRRELVDNPGSDNPGGFLQRVEASDTAIRTKTLQVTVNRANSKLIDAKATFSAYEPQSSTKP